MNLPDHCPKCNANFDGVPVPGDFNEHYPPDARWSRAISIYDREKDRTVAWKCPDCGHEAAA